MYNWEIETVEGIVLRQYNEDGSENSWKQLDADKIVRVTYIPKIALLPSHSCLIDISKGERFIRRHRSNFRTEIKTNLDRILELYNLNRNNTFKEALTTYKMTMESPLEEILIKHFRMDKSTPIYKKVTEKFPPDTPVGNIGKENEKFGFILDRLGLPKNEIKKQWVECITTNRYRFWLFQDGKTLITRNNYEVNL